MDLTQLKAAREEALRRSRPARVASLDRQIAELEPPKKGRRVPAKKAAAKTTAKKAPAKKTVAKKAATTKTAAKKAVKKTAKKVAKKR